MAKSVQRCQPKSSTLAVNMHPYESAQFSGGRLLLDRINPSRDHLQSYIHTSRPRCMGFKASYHLACHSTDVLKGYASHRNHCKRLYGGLGGLSGEQHTGTFVSVLPQRPIAAEIELVKAHPSIVNSLTYCSSCFYAAPRLNAVFMLSADRASRNGLRRTSPRCTR